MKKNQLLYRIRRIVLPVLLILMGLVLVLFPDSASALLSSLMAWGMVLVGIGCLLVSVLSLNRLSLGILGAIAVLLSGFLLKNPLFLARNAGRILGILLALEGIGSFRKVPEGRLLGMLTLIGAIVLLTAPMTASRLVFGLCGLLLVALGIGQLLILNRHRRFLNGDNDSNIIDAL